MRYFFEVAYNGTNYHGWQRQKNAISVQEVLEEGLSTILRDNIDLIGSGRTDTGVHCRQQYFHIDVKQPITDQLRYNLNNYLPHDIAINSIHRVTEEAHARFSATSRSYEYLIHTSKNPFLENLSYYYSRPLDLKTMNEAATLLIGKQDFESFSRVKTEVNNFICDITEADWSQEGEVISFNISANRFLRGMVRAIVGTLLSVGQGKITVADFRKIIDAKDRKIAGVAAPAHGLYLVKVDYPQEIYI